MRVIVTGGRDYSNYELVAQTLDTYEVHEVAEGGASGADRLAALWAHDRHATCRTYPAEWSKYGRWAGPRRNQIMLEDFLPQMVIAFPGGKGTADMIRRATEAGVPVIEIEDP
jgi:hypothetical protein